MKKKTKILIPNPHRVILLLGCGCFSRYDPNRNRKKKSCATHKTNSK